jgi:hypothetical protein
MSGDEASLAAKQNTRSPALLQQPRQRTQRANSAKEELTCSTDLWQLNTPNIPPSGNYLKHFDEDLCALGTYRSTFDIKQKQNKL